MERESLAGRRFCRWTVLDNFIEVKNARGKTERKWLCRCDCGTERYVLERGLIHGGTQSCGCLSRERTRVRTAHNLTGKTFGDLTVLEEVEKRAPSGAVQWLCRCSCGEEYVVAGSMLVTGRVTHCSKRNVHRDKRKSKAVDVAGQKFKHLTAMYPTQERCGKGNVIWHCRCDCGNEVDVSYNDLLYSHTQSCGCKKRENDRRLYTRLTHVAGTSLEMIKSQKLPTDNTTGYRGVYFINGKYTAKIVFQKKQLYLGVFSTPEEAAKARKEAEVLLFDGTADYYSRWQKRAEADPEWARDNPVSIQVSRDSAGELTVSYSPLV